MSKGSAFGTMVPAFLFIGIGVGLWTTQVLASILIGFGLGLTASYLAAQRNNR